jgi:hypothetical protein
VKGVEIVKEGRDDSLGFWRTFLLFPSWDSSNIAVKMFRFCEGRFLASFWMGFRRGCF